MKLGFSTLGCPSYSVDQVIELAVRSGYDGVELRFLRGEVNLPAREPSRSPRSSPCCAPAATAAT